jgi:hypothetical protein
MNNLLNKIKRINFEAWIWITGLTILALLKPDSQEHFTSVLLKILGLNTARDVGWDIPFFLFHGNITASLRTHILGIPTVIILSVRTVSIIKKSSSNFPLKID